LAGIPPTFRGVSGGFAVVTGHRQQGGCDQWAAYAQVETLIILMAVARRTQIAQCLIRLGRDASQPVAFIENGTTPRERVVVTTLAEVAAGQVEVSNPAVMIAGDVVHQRTCLLTVAERFSFA
jgi:uroporphyrin-III C-methyltransferase